MKFLKKLNKESILKFARKFIIKVLLACIINFIAKEIIIVLQSL